LNEFEFFIMLRTPSSCTVYQPVRDAGNLD